MNSKNESKRANKAAQNTMARTIGLYPTDRYEFKTNAAYREKWSFLPGKERLGIIASQLTYLEFHAWLKDNLRHAFPEKPPVAPV